MFKRENRSTKAGAETPATPPLRGLDTDIDGPAQRRPGLKPRLHPAVCGGEGGGALAQRRPGLKPRLHDANHHFLRGELLRSTKAGAETPATPLAQPQIAALSRTRSTKAGAETPATLVSTVWPQSALKDAQRRPGLKPRLHP